MTFKWPRLTWPAWEARQTGPRWRKMSATSTAGRDTGGASARHLQQNIERARHLADPADGHAGVKRHRIALLVSEQHLDDPEIRLLFHDMRVQAVPQGMNTHSLGDPCQCCRPAD